MRDRIKEIRKSLGLTQSEFGAKIAVKGNTITTYETGTRIPSDAVILSICRTFDINEEWLRTGQGEKDLPLPMEAHLMALFSDVANETDTFRRALFSTMAKMTPDEWKILERIACDLKEEMDKQA